MASRSVVDFKMRNLFFNEKGILRYMNRGSATALNIFGARVKRDMKKSIKRKAPTALQLQKAQASNTNVRQRKRAIRTITKRRQLRSKPYHPPFSHVANDKAGLRNILYAFNRLDKSVVIGPLKFAGMRGKPVPGVLEHGGRNPIRRRKRRRYRQAWRRFVARRVLERNIKVLPRPFSRPAGVKHLTMFPKILEAALKGTPAKRVRKIA